MVYTFPTTAAAHSNEWMCLETRNGGGWEGILQETWGRNLETWGNSGTGSCEKIGFANFASDLKCIPTSQTSFIADSEQKFARLNSRQIREIDFFTAS